MTTTSLPLLIARPGGIALLIVAALSFSCEEAKKDPAPAPANEAAETLPGDPGAPWTHEQTPENLEALFREIVTSAHGGNLARAAALTRDLVPNAGRFGKALNERAPAGLAEQAAQDLAARMPEGEALAFFFVPTKEQTELVLHEASTEALWMRRANSAAAEHFDTGTENAAKLVLRAGERFYALEAKVPESDDRGAHHQPFFWDGERWTYLGRFWRFLTEQPTPNLSADQCRAMGEHMRALMEKVDRRSGHIIGKHFADEGMERCEEKGLPPRVFECRLAAETLEAWSQCDTL